jgi:hypothetical protein
MGWGLYCKVCRLEWHWTADTGVYAYSRLETRYEKDPWVMVPMGTLPVFIEEREGRAKLCANGATRRRRACLRPTG